MSNSFLEPAPSRRAGPIAIIIAAIAVVVLAVGAVIYFVIDSSGDHDQDVVVQPTLSVPTGPLTLIKGTYSVEGVSVGYPHTVAGAVSAAAEYWTQLGSTLDPERGAAIGKLVGDAESWGDPGAKFAEGRLKARQSLGVPAKGSVPAGVSMTLGVSAYQLRNPSTDEVTVLLLAYLSTSSNSGGVQGYIAVFPALMRWIDGDWKFARSTDGTDYSSLRARPNSPEAQAAGWMELRP